MKSGSEYLPGIVADMFGMMIATDFEGRYDDEEKAVELDDGRAVWVSVEIGDGILFCARCVEPNHSEVTLQSDRPDIIVRYLRNGG